MNIFKSKIIVPLNWFYKMVKKGLKKKQQRTVVFTIKRKTKIMETLLFVNNRSTVTIDKSLGNRKTIENTA